VHLPCQLINRRFIVEKTLQVWVKSENTLVGEGADFAFSDEFGEIGSYNGMLSV
jgi:hypothetical protein